MCIRDRALRAAAGPPALRRAAASLLAVAMRARAACGAAEGGGAAGGGAAAEAAARWLAAQPWLAAAARDELTGFVRSEAEAADAPSTPPPLSATKSFGLLPPSRPSTAPKLL